ncbi:geranylgeranylglycerol-phosphate geranylgeranyltransferase [Aegicerativicinus sediminis]|uniref:geranylgeranylglycerol-phosphate geranylgeranyltransferase n=1 Tax=Aegicerativicinus sediminis TaxID=2893202 RepID=UPI001E2DE65B|nr:geranylgeranylglycerol-phosphate geranylgeranyltransferase [Aegicerativicinus sediminis]
MSLLKLIRWKNLLMIALVQILIKYCLFEPFGATITLNGFGLFLLILSTVFIAAAGYIINDINDVGTDQINHDKNVVATKKISEKNAYNLFIIFNLTGVALGFYLSYLVGRNGFFAIFVISSALLYLYATYLKQTMLIGNIIVALLVALSLLIVGIFDLIPVVTEMNRASQITFFEILVDYSIFAFIMTILREIAKDLQDIEGDHNAGMNTLPVALGRARATKVLFVLNILATLVVVYYLITYVYKQQWLIYYFALLVIAPLIFTAIKSFSAETKKDYQQLSLVYKLIMLTGILSMAIYPFVILEA